MVRGDNKPTACQLKHCSSAQPCASLLSCLVVAIMMFKVPTTLRLV